MLLDLAYKINLRVTELHKGSLLLSVILSSSVIMMHCEPVDEGVSVPN